MCAVKTNIFANTFVAEQYFANYVVFSSSIKCLYIICIICIYIYTYILYIYIYILESFKIREKAHDLK